MQVLLDYLVEPMPDRLGEWDGDRVFLIFICSCS